MNHEHIKLQRLPKRAIQAGATPPNPMLGVEKLFNDAIRSMLRGIPMPGHLWMALSWIPRLSRGFTYLHMAREDVLQEIEPLPAPAFYALAGTAANRDRFQSLVRRLEPAIVSDAEILAIYLSWAAQAHVPLPLPFEAYREAMMRSPLFGVRWAKSIGDESFAFDLMEWAFANSQKQAAAAWAVCVAESLDPEPYRPVLALNPLYAVASASAFGMKFGIGDFQSKLEPRWMYHLLANNACEDPDAMEDNLLRDDPLWGLEWLFESGDSSVHGGNREKWPPILAGLKRWENQKHPMLTVAIKALQSISESISKRRSGDDEDREAQEAQEQDSAEEGENSQ